MELEATVQYGAGKAVYKIRTENPGIYYASLLDFDADDKEYPPMKITLVRGVRYWTGSDDNESLINALGQSIESYLNTPFNKKQGSK